MKSDGVSLAYKVECDRINKAEWSACLARFRDATIYQTWSFGNIVWGEGNLRHVVLRKDGEIVAAAQVRVARIPVLGAGIAYVSAGPLWKQRGGQRDTDVFRQMVRALRGEYVEKQRLLLRVASMEIQDEANPVLAILNEEGFERSSIRKARKTILVELAPSLDDLRKGLSKEWRKRLRQVERANLVVSVGTTDELYGVFVRLYREMHARKGFVEYASIDEFRKIQQDLPEGLKMRVAVCEFEGEPVAGRVWSAIGDVGIPIFSATGNKGLKLYGSYLLLWKMWEELKEKQVPLMDMGGVDARSNPGGYRFKSGVGGREVCYVGDFDACQSLLSHFLVKWAEIARMFYWKVRASFQGGEFSIVSPASTESVLQLKC